MALPNKFGIRLHESGWTGEIAVATGFYQHAAAAVPAILGISTPVDLEIWSMIPSIQDKHFNYRVAENEFGQLIVKTLVRAHGQDASTLSAK